MTIYAQFICSRGGFGSQRQQYGGCRVKRYKRYSQARGKIMLYKKLKINNPDGLAADAAQNLVYTASQFQSNILVEFSSKKVNAKSIMGLLSLRAKHGDSIYVFAVGEDEQEALIALDALNV
jgi:phosphotransferase system HPr (HPr) family protein